MRLYRVSSRGTSVWAGLVLALGSWAVACSPDHDPAGPPGDDGPNFTPSRVVISNPAVSAEPVFVSLPPGSVPGGTSATIRNLQTAMSVTVPMMDGGFDPVPLDAIVGDSLEVQVMVGGVAPPIKYLLRVPANAPPIVVRTEPTSGKRDVPLNARIIVVFSEPIDPTALTSGAIRLTRGANEVPGRVQFVDGWHLMVEFVPLAPLVPDDDYELSITKEILDLDGDPLGSPVNVAFTTSSASANHLEFTVQPSNTALGSAITPAVVVKVFDGLGRMVTDSPDSIAITLAQNPGGMPLAGTTKVAVVRGVAAWTDLRVQAIGTGYQLEASAAGVAPATSATFVVAANTVPILMRLVPDAIQVPQGGGANTQVLNTGASVLAVAGLPAGFTATTGRLQLYRYLAVHVDPTVPPGRYDLLVRSTSSTQSDSIVLPVTVTASSAGFALTLAQPAAMVYSGDTKSIGVTIDRTTDSGAVTLSKVDPSSGASSVFDILSPAETSSTLSQASLSGFHLFRVVGTGTAGSTSAELYVYTPRVTPGPPSP